MTKYVTAEERTVSSLGKPCEWCIHVEMSPHRAVLEIHVFEEDVHEPREFYICQEHFACCPPGLLGGPVFDKVFVRVSEE